MRRAERSMVPETKPTSYYGRPVLKAPTWRWPIPAYLFSGGVAAGTAVMAAGTRLAGDEDLAGRANLASLGAVVASTGFLVHDLGRPARFHHMLRVAKPTSPMSVGTWIFSAFAALTGAGAAAAVARVAGVGSARGLRGRPGPPRPLDRVAAGAGLAAAAVAPALATYTAALVSDTAVPAWHEARRHLPWLFAASATASGGAVTTLLAVTRGRGLTPASRAVRTLTVVAAGAELVADAAMRRHLERITTGDPDAPDLAFPYRQGRAHRLSTAARVATAVGAVLVALGRGGVCADANGHRRRPPLVSAGALAVAAGSALQRFAIFTAGGDTARHPAYTVGPQRAGIDLGRGLL